MVHRYKLSLIHVFFLALSLLTGSASAQRISNVVFSQLPQNYQLYPRNEQNTAQIPVAGRVEDAGWEAVSVKLFRNKQVVGYQRIALSYSGGNAPFRAVPLTIRAEKAEYDVSVYLVKGSDSTNVVTRANIVAGDVLVLAGQSNAGAFFRDTRTNEFCRTFGVITDDYNKGAYNPADTAWALSNQTVYTQNVGAMGFGVQQYILDKYGIPTCLINGAAHWSSMADQATRTAGNITDLNTIYGRLLYRLQKAGLTNYVKTWIYRQGETEAYGEAPDWLGNFRRYYQNLKTDLPTIRQFYVYQIDIIDPSVAAAPVVREAQRTLPRTSPDIQVLASMGTAGFDAIHYSDEGYQQNATELGRLIGRDFYGDPDSDNIDAPNLRRAYYSTAARDEITLLFNPGQRMRWNEARGSLNLRQFLYLNGQPWVVQSGRADGNRIILKLNQPSSATKLTYLPAAYTSQQPDYPYQGPYLTNSREMRALSFLEVPVGTDNSTDVPTLSTPVVTTLALSATAVQVSWNAVTGAGNYVLERKDPSANTFSVVEQLPHTQQTYLFEGLQPLSAYTFRVKAVLRDDESAYGQASVTTPSLLATPELTGSATYANAVRLNWKAVPDALGYVLERRLASGGAFAVIATFAPTTLTYLDSLLADNQTYVYQLKATGRYLDSPYGQVQVQTPAYLAAPELTVTPTFNNAMQLSWKAVAGATSYRLSRQTGNGDAQVLSTPGASVTTFSDTGLQPGGSYTYLLQAFGDRTESAVTRAAAQTPGLLTTPTLSSTVVYNNRLQLAWSGITNATTYQVERMSAGQAFVAIGSYGSQTTTLTDSTLTPGTAYTYRIRAKSALSESSFGSLTVNTPALLATPVLSVTALYNNALRVGWASVAGATSYRLERQTAGQAFVTMGAFAATTTALRDTALVPGTSYTYRLHAFGDRTESGLGSVVAATPALLAAPALTVTPVAFDTLRLVWNAVPEAAYYVLERRKEGETAYNFSMRVDPSTSRYNDAGLQPVTTYQYRLTAFNDKTNSPTIGASATTLVLLATRQEPLALFRLWPNPARGQVTLQFARPVSGSVQLIDLLGTVRGRQTIQQTTETRLDLPEGAAGTYLIRVESEGSVLVQKLLIE